MAIAPDEHPRDTLGRAARPMRYPIQHTVKFSEDADATLKEMAELQDMKIGKIIRRAVMKEIYIYKAKQKRKEQQA